VDEQLAAEALVLSVVGRVCLFLIAIWLLSGVKRSSSVLTSFPSWFLAYSFLFVTFIILSDKRVLNKITDSNASPSNNCSIVFAVYMLIARELVFCNYRVLAGFFGYFVVVYLSIFLGTEVSNARSAIGELLILTVTMISFFYTTRNVEVTSKSLFRQKIESEKMAE
jgi:hypothetical protein